MDIIDNAKRLLIKIKSISTIVRTDFPYTAHRQSSL